MKNKLSCIIVLLFMCYSSLFAQQEETLIYDSERIHNPHYDSLNNPIKKYLQVLQLADPLVTIGLAPQFFPLESRSTKLQDGEGACGYILENNFEARLPIYFGGIYSSDFFQKIRFTFDGGYTVRMTMDKSSPLVPNNNRFGFGADYLWSKNTFLTVQIHHYSNGQSDNVFHLTESPYRNNYKNGDFSTNYLKIMPINYFQNLSNFTGILSLGYRAEISMGDTFLRSPELKGSYGLHRALFDINLVKNRFVKIEKNNNENNYEITKIRDWGLRLNTEFILDPNLDKFPHANKHRLSATMTGYYYPWQKGLMGFFAKIHYGRDYLNIRYDDVVFSAQVGLIFDLPRSIHKIY